MIVEFVYLVLDSRQGLKGRELKTFMSKFDSLDRQEVLDALQVPEDEFMRILNQVVECIGCRRIIERVFQQFKKNGSQTLDPITITPEGVVRIRQDRLDDGQVDVCKLLQKSVFLYAGLLTYKQRSKQSIRCTIHNLDAYKVTPFSETWTQIWVSMRGPCREKILIIDMEDLQATLDVYLKKHKFCHECSAKVETAFHLLFREKNPRKEPGYAEELYAGIKRCLNQHIQLPCKVDFIDMLIRRAEPELVGNGNRQRERHAKTLEIAQEEVLTCIGMCIFERFRRIHNCRKEEEGACQLLAVLALHGMYRSFDVAVEKKRGISNLELLYDEIIQQELREVQRKEQKRLKKRQKKMEKRSLCSSCKEGVEHEHVEDDMEGEEEEAKHSCRGSKKAKRKSRCDSENDVLDGEEEQEEEQEDEEDDDEPSMHELELMVAHKTSSKSTGKSHNNNINKRQQQQQNNSKPHNHNPAKKQGTPAPSLKQQQQQQNQPPQTKRSGKDNTNKDGGLPVLKQNINQSAPSIAACATCDDNNQAHSQPISVDCGYVSDQLSLTNCSSTSCSSSSSLEDPLCKGGGIEEEVEEEEEERVAIPIGNAPCSSPLTINSQLSSLSSSPEGSEVACHDGLCNHVQGPSTIKEEEDSAEEVVLKAPPVAQQPPIAGGVTAVAGSYIPEELINEFRSKHRNLKEVREELRRNLRQSFAQFCLKNKNRPLSHLCRTGRCQTVDGLEGMCSGECE